MSRWHLVVVSSLLVLLCFSLATSTDPEVLIDEDSSTPPPPPPNTDAPSKEKPQKRESIFADGTGSQQVFEEDGSGFTFDDLYDMMMDFGEYDYDESEDLKAAKGEL